MESHLLHPIVNSIDRFTYLTGRVVSWFSLFMVLVTFCIVVFRYGFNMGWIAMQESVLYMHGLIFLLGSAYTLKEGGHVRIDVLYQKYSLKTKALVDLLGTLFLLMPVCIFIFYISFDYVLAAWKVMEESAQPGGLPFVYVSKTFLLLFSITLILQGISEAIRNFLVYKAEVKTENNSLNKVEGV